MPHGMDLLRCLERVRSAQNTEESTSCTLSIKIEPDSRGTSPGMTSTLTIACGSLLRRQINVIHEQRIDTGLPERHDRVGRRADDRLAVVERRVDDKRHAGQFVERGD